MSPSSPLEVRRLATTDLAALETEVARARLAGEFRASSDVQGDYLIKSFGVDPDRFGGAFAGDTLVGFIAPDFKFVAVRPDHRRTGVGRSLVEFGLTLEQQHGRDALILGVDPKDNGSHAFVAATGFTMHSTLWDLDLPPASSIEPPMWPVGMVARAFNRATDLDAWVELFNVAFIDHATPLQIDRATILAGLDDPAFLDADTLVVVDGADGGLVGFCSTTPDRTTEALAATGEIWTIGVRPGRQGAGLGRQLVRWGAGYLRAIGATDIWLSVNGRNERALGLYESEGFVRRRTRERWSRSADGHPER